MIERIALVTQIDTALHRNRIVALVGARQSGKTTLARTFLQPDSANYFDLEDLTSLARLEQPMTALQSLSGLVVIDEIQRKPDLFPLLRVLADRQPLPAKFLILGSASPNLIRSASESLAGRIETITVSGFQLAEVGASASQQLWLRGGFPLSYLADSLADSFAWRKNFIQTFLERDLPSWGVQAPPVTLLRFWTMLAHYHAQVWNGAEIARALGVSQVTVRRYQDILEGAFMLRVLPPWHANISKRQVKSPKLYFRDSGILHYLLGIRSDADLYLHPKIGASWEGWVIEQVIQALAPDEAYFWAAHSGAELDLLLIKDGQRIGVECKREDAPRLTPSMRAAITDLRLDRLLVIYPGAVAYPLAARASTLPAARLATPPETWQA
jgi:hypothetical protein